MPKKGELSKTARASLANREEANHLTNRICLSAAKQSCSKNFSL